MVSKRFNRLVECIEKYNKNFDHEQLERAYNLAKTAHSGQLRASGEPFINHPLEVAYILADLEMDVPSIIAGLLHDTVEDTTSTVEEIEEMFGKEVAMLVDGVTKLSKFTFQSKEEQQAENLRKMLLAMAKDIRVIVIKLADRLHNMRTLRYKSQGKQIEKARETMDIYAPLAHRLGISRIKWELEDLSLWYLDPEGYYDLVDGIAIKRREREAFIESTKKTLQEKVASLGIKGAVVDGRAKHFYSIYRKMQKQNKTIDQIYDLFAFRIIVPTVKECYAVLGLVHELYKPMPGRFKDYIAMPKPNMYQSLHTTVMGAEGNIFEVQVRTFEMHKTAEVGIAAHWKYKEGKQTIGNENNIDKELDWLREILEHQKEANSAHEFLENLKIDLFTDEVFVFTPKGKVINLPNGSCPIDFAYAIHSEVGNKTIGAKVNGKMVTLNYKLNNGDIVEVLTSSNSRGPGADWIKIVKSSQARNKINQWFKREKRDENILKGKELFEGEIKRLGIPLAKIIKSDAIQKVMEKNRYNTYDDLLVAVGLGAISVQKLLGKIRDELRKSFDDEEQFLADFGQMEVREQEKNVRTDKIETRLKSVSQTGINVKGVDNCMVKFAHCCNPVPGDKIVGFVTKGHGVSVHRADCLNIINLKDSEDTGERLIDVEWDVNSSDSNKMKYVSEIHIYAIDRTNLLNDVINVLSELKVNIMAINARVGDDRTAEVCLSLAITDSQQADLVIKKLQNIKSVYDVQR